MPTNAASSSFGSRHGAALAGLLLLALAAYGFLLTPGRAPYSPHSDFLAHGVGAETVRYRSLHEGRGLPFWRSDELSGNPALTDPANAFLSPLNALFLVLPTEDAAGPSLWLYFFLAGISGYALAAALELGTAARVLTGVASLFQFKLIALGYAGWLWSCPSLCVLPLVYAAVFYALRRPGGRAAAAIGAAGGLALVSGQIQVAYYSVLALGIAAAAASGSKRTAAALAGGAALAAGVAAALLLPLAADAPLLSRARVTEEFFRSGHALDFRHLLTFLRPEALPGAEAWEDAGYFGLLPLLAAGAGAFFGWRRPLTRALALGFALSLAAAFSTKLQGVLLAVLPGFKLFRLPVRFLFPASWFGLALAGVGWDALLSRVKNRRAALLAAAAAALIMTAEGCWYARRYLTMRSADAVMPPALEKIFFERHPGLYRVAPLQRAALNYGWAAPLGVQLATGYESLNYASYQTYFDYLRWNKRGPEGARVWTDLPSVSRPDLLDALGVRYLVSLKPERLPTDRFAPAVRLAGVAVYEHYKGVRDADIYVYENRKAKPRAFFVARALRAPDGAAAEALLASESVADAAIYEAPSDGPVSTGSPGDSVEILSSRPGGLELVVRAGAPRFLVISEVWNPGWTAALDGAPMTLLRADLALLGAWIPAGEHRVSLAFRPAGWGAGVAISLLSLAACLLCYALGHAGPGFLARRGLRLLP